MSLEPPDDVFLDTNEDAPEQEQQVAPPKTVVVKQNGPRLPGMPKPVPRSRQQALAEQDWGVLRTKNQTREEWIEQGRLLGEDEADKRGETGVTREQRVARAKAYAAWEWDGKPSGGAHLKEFGVPTANDFVSSRTSDFKKTMDKKDK